MNEGFAAFYADKIDKVSVAEFNKRVDDLELRLDQRIDTHRNNFAELMQVIGLTYDGERETFTLGRRWNADTETWQELKLVKEWRDAA